MSKSTLEQALLSREQMKNEFERATESSRAALSAISGRNILKTKKETERIRRDEEIAAQSRAAQIAKAQADQGISLEQSRLSFDQSEQKREEQRRKADRSLDADLAADRRREAMEMLSVGVYDPSFSAELGISDGVVRQFAEKKDAERREKVAAKRRVESAKAEYEASLQAIEAAKKKKATAAGARTYEKRIESAIDGHSGETSDPDAAKVEIFKAETKRNGPMIEIDEKDGVGILKSLASSEVIAQAREISDYYDLVLTKRIRAKEKAEKELSVLEESYREKYQNTTEYAINSAKYDLKIAADSGDMDSYNKAFSDYLDTFDAAIKKTGADARLIFTTADAKRQKLERLTEEERNEVRAQISAVEEMIAAIDRELNTVDFSVDQQDALEEMKGDFERILSALKVEDAYGADYEENAEDYESRREFLEMDEQYYAYTVEELEELHTKEISTLKEELGQIEQRMGGYERGHLQHTDQYKADAERKKEIEDLIAEKNDDKKGLAEYIKTRKTNEKNDAEYEAVLMEARNAFNGDDPERIDALLAHTNEKKREWQGYLAALSWKGNHDTGYMPPYPHEITEDNQVYYIFSNGNRMYLGRYENNRVVGGRPEDQKRAREEVAALEEKERMITGVYHREVMNFAEEMIPDEVLAEKAAEFSLAGFSEIADKYKRGGQYFDGNYKDFKSDVEGFAAGDYGFFEKSQADRVLALLADGKDELAFNYYANAREQALLSEAEDIHWAWRATKGGFSGLTRFMTQGGYMIENALTGSYERMAGTLGTASHQVTMEKLDQMGFGGGALEMIYMSGYTILDMVPAVVMGVAGNAVAPGLGSAVASGYIFAKSMATTYTEDIAAGKRADEALTHGVLVGTAEVAMAKLLGSLPGITSKNGLFTKLKDGLSRLATTKGAQIAIKYSSSLGAEGFEEFMQVVISPFLSKVAADLNGIEGAELEEIDWEEAGRSFLFGAITGSAFSVAYAPFENRAMEIEAARTLQGGEVAELIEIGAGLENKTALKIKEAMQTEQPRYKGAEGLAAFVSEKDIANIQKSIRSRKVKGAAKKLSGMIEANMKGADPSEIKRAKVIFRKVLTAQTLTLEEASAIAKDERLLSVLEGMMGERLLGKDLSPRQVALLARLASFTDENGKVSKARLALFKDAFGEFDTKAIEQMIRYDSMAGILEDGVIYEGETALDETQQEAVETLNVLSEMSGIHFLVTDQHQTGDFLASGLMAVNPADLDQGVFYAIGHQAYQMMQQLHPERGAELRESILQEAKNTLGEEGVAAEIKAIQQQKAVNGLEYSEEMAKDELCAQCLPQMLLKGESIERIAQGDIETANTLRKILRSIQEHLSDVSTPTEIRTDMPENYRYNYLKNKTIAAAEGVDLSPYQEELEALAKLDPKAKSKSQVIIERIADSIKVLNKPLQHPELDYRFAFSKDSLKKSIHHQREYGGDYLNFAKVLINFESILENAVLIERHSDKYSGTTRENEHLEHVSILVGTLKDGNVYIPVQFEIKKSDTGQNTLYLTVALKNVEAKKIEADVMEPVWTREGTAQALVSTSNISISKLFENVNPEDRNFLKYVPERFLNKDQRTAKTDSMEAEAKRVGNLFKDQGGKRTDLWGDTNAVHEKLTALIKQDRAARYGYGIGKTVESEGIKAELPRKAEEYIKRAKRELLESIGYGRRTKEGKWIESIVDKMVEEYLNDGEIFEATKQLLVNATDAYIDEDSVGNVTKKLEGKLKTAKRYIDEKSGGQKTEKELISVDEAFSLFEKMKEQQKNAAKAVARNLLTTEDEILVGQLLRKELLPDQVGQYTENIEGVLDVYAAKKEYEELAKKIRDYRIKLKEKYRADAATFLKSIDKWKDKKAGIFYQRETMERNIRDIVDDPEVAEAIIARYFMPVHKAVAAENLLKNEYRSRVKALKLSRGVEKGDSVSEAHAVQLLGEAMENIRVIEESDGKLFKRDGKTKEEWEEAIEKLWETSPGLNREKIQGAVESFREIYDELIERMNEVRVRNGYEPVRYRRGYFPHFQPKENADELSIFGKVFGIKTEVTNLPTTINGLTHTFRPGIQWFGNAMERIGFSTVYDAVEGFDKYIEGAASVICQTDNIQSLRALAAQIRYMASDEGVKAQIDAIYSDSTLDMDEAQTKIESLFENGRFALSNFVVELEEYTNLLANKRSRFDRGVERAFGRKMYNIVKALESRVAANLVGGNVSSWFPNIIPLFQGSAELGSVDLTTAMFETLKAIRSDDGFTVKSAFLTNRRGSSPLVSMWTERAPNIVGKPMEWIDLFVADTLVRARYKQNVRAGMSEELAMEEADGWAAGVMGDRSKGATPTIFSSQNPLIKVLTQFQLEPNNTISHILKDVPYHFREKAKTALVWTLFRFLLCSLLFNDAYEKLFGRRPAFDPIGILNESVGDLTGYQLPNLIDAVGDVASGKMPNFKTERKKTNEAIATFGKNVAEQIPFFGGLIDGGRFPVSAALPDFGKLRNAIFSKDWDEKKKIDVYLKELGKIFWYLTLPFGGGQAKKAVQGVRAVVRDGSYSVNAKGEELLQYPVFSDSTAEAFKNWLRMTLFGKTSSKEALEWIDSGFDGFGAKETDLYKSLIESGCGSRNAYRSIAELGGLEDKDEKRKYIEKLAMTDDQKMILFRYTLSESALESVEGLSAAGIPAGDVMEAYAEYRKIDADETLEKEKDKATEFAYFLDQVVEDPKHRKMIKQAKGFTYGTMGSVAAEEYEKMTDAGLAPDDAYDVYFGISALEPQGDRETVAAVEKYVEIGEHHLSDEAAKAALLIYATESDERRMNLSFENDVTAEQFIAIKVNLEIANDAAGKNSASNGRIQAAIASTDGLTLRQQAILWQLFTGSTSAKNNPFSVSIGWETVAQIEAYKKARED